ncbi:MAG: hypothetical protein ACQETH_15235 [Candidatus Rifleibacteriota bacterium]
MKKIWTSLLILSIILTFADSAAAMQPAEFKTLKAVEFEIKGFGEKLQAIKFVKNDEIGILIETLKGKTLLKMPGLGVKDKTFNIDGKAESLIVKDLTGDKVPEVIASAYYGPASGLYIFKYIANKKKFEPVKFVDSKDESMHRKFMVSDLPAENGTDMMIMKDNTLRSLGKIYPATLDEKPRPGHYFFKFKKDAFHLIRCTPVKD